MFPSVGHRAPTRTGIPLAWGDDSALSIGRTRSSTHHIVNGHALNTVNVRASHPATAAKTTAQRFRAAVVRGPVMSLGRYKLLSGYRQRGVCGGRERDAAKLCAACRPAKEIFLGTARVLGGGERGGKETPDRRHNVVGIFGSHAVMAEGIIYYIPRRGFRGIQRNVDIRFRAGGEECGSSRR